ncbi:hypothetical protein JIG36_49640 [Actinoplanes sp. LDG1-06]|uniref:Short chain dehydrogenase n=1 Tax=Paractinoplanes ovalisporus TaxID=2810368 RepID=A0ABS2AUM9_9ACTN|nr:hypothetical protein [Actinoplanes ovalisporus]MBM2623579.1 hypothetical protein [Actinoplanes ovalisporus]
MTSQPDVVVVTGAGGMGTAVARRLGGGRTVLLADASPDALDRAVAHAVRRRLIRRTARYNAASP